MALSFSTSMATLLILGLALGAPAAEAQTCGQTVNYLAPCISYLTGRGVVPPPVCCTGVRNLNNAAVGTPARRAACICLKGVIPSIPGLIAPRITSLPGRCGVKLPFTVSPTTDCNKVT